jgi:ribonuclease VapC
LIVDTSAIVAILRGEPDADRFAEALGHATAPRLAAGSYLETAIVIDANRDPVLSGRLDDLLSAARINIEPVTERHAQIARQAYRDFGKSSGHPAGLNLGDCFAYALARDSGEPLLFKGNDFTQTDVASALDPGTESSAPD